MDFYYLKKKYQDYIKPFCCERAMFDKNGMNRAYIGVVFQNQNGMSYFAPITSASKKYLAQQEDIYAFKKTRGGINLNLMLPVPQAALVRINVGSLREKYKMLLQTEWREIKQPLVQKEIKTKAMGVYEKVLKTPESNLAKRSNNFKLLEQKCREWEMARGQEPSASATTPDIKKDANTALLLKLKQVKSEQADPSSILNQMLYADEGMSYKIGAYSPKGKGHVVFTDVNRNVYLGVHFPPDGMKLGAYPKSKYVKMIGEGATGFKKACDQLNKLTSKFVLD